MAVHRRRSIARAQTTLLNVEHVQPAGLGAAITATDDGINSARTYSTGRLHYCSAALNGLLAMIVTYRSPSSGDARMAGARCGGTERAASPASHRLLLITARGKQKKLPSVVLLTSSHARRVNWPSQPPPLPAGSRCSPQDLPLPARTAAPRKTSRSTLHRSHGRRIRPRIVKIR
ncbi:Hypothetical protein NTJ_03987 [Nesidiocoris tenuis]|uniref:Uncharacterized protein n=1 Tax=Nesidiocoris tenuis TaxID=355587 RepID=A0ABN7AGU2_9HEMI|nr:Hypothetical protein NTJ_03987 [Nesidiocoris tenuis]